MLSLELLPRRVPKHKRDAAANRNDLFAGANKNNKPLSSSNNSRPPATSRLKAPSPAAVPASSKGYAGRKEKTMANNLSGEAKAAKLQHVQDFRDNANKCMRKSYLSKPDPVAASTYFKRAADAYQQCGEDRVFDYIPSQCWLRIQDSGEEFSYTIAAHSYLLVDLFVHAFKRINVTTS